MSLDEAEDSTPSFGTMTVPLPAEPGAALTARELVAANAHFLPADLREDAVLLVSELVTNALRHGEPDIMLHVATAPGTVRVDVHDRGAALPVRSENYPEAPHASGRGLFIVEALATRWGVTSTVDPSGKSVWFELNVASSPCPALAPY